MFVKTHSVALFIACCLSGAICSLRGMNIELLPYQKARDYEAIHAISIEGESDGILYATASLTCGKTVVACSEGKTVGFINYLGEDAIIFQQPNPCIAYLGVANHMQRKGIGHKLLVYAIDDIKSQGLKCIELMVKKTSFPAMTLYKTIGFVEKLEQQSRDFTEMIYRAS